MADENSAAADSPPGPSEGNANNGDVPPRGGRRLAVPLPAKLEMRGDMSSNWRRFERMWRNYEIVTRLREETAEFRTATLLTCIGSEALDVYEGLPFDDDANERQNVEVVLQKFQEFCLGEVNETYESYMFFCRNQDAGETVESYITTLRKMVKTCNFGRLEDRLLRDRVVMGILDENLRSKLLEVRQLDLKQCVDCCRAFESSKHKTKAMTVSQPAHEDLHWVKNRKLTNKTWNQRKPVDNLKKKCMFCGKLHVLDKRHCPAFGKECLKCHRRNHFAEVCKQAKHEAKVHTVDMEKEEYILVVNQGNTYSRTITATMNIGRETLNFQLDSGATVNVLPESEYIRVTGDSNLQHLDRAESKLLMYNKTEVIPTGQRILTVKNPKNEETYKVRFIVVKSDCKPILGLRAVQHMQLITVNKENIAVVTTSKDDDLMKTYQDVFTGEGRLEGDLHLVTDDTVTPVKLPCRKWPLSVRENVKSELERLTKMEIVTQVDTPTDWISSIVVVAKSNNKIRLCIDPKPLNKALLELRNVPTEKMEYSPVQRLFGRRTRTKLPIAKRLLKPETCTRVVEKLLEKKERQAFYYDRGAKELKPLERGQVVRFRPPGYRKWKKAVVDDQTDVRSYAIRTEDGRRYRRNRSHLRTTTESSSETAQQMLEQQQHPPNEYPSFNNEDDANVAASTTTAVRETTCTPVQRPDARSPPRQRMSGRIVKKPNFLKDYIQ